MYYLVFSLSCFLAWGGTAGHMKAQPLGDILGLLLGQRHECARDAGPGGVKERHVDGEVTQRQFRVLLDRPRRLMGRQSMLQDLVCSMEEFAHRLGSLFIPRLQQAMTEKSTFPEL